MISSTNTLKNLVVLIRFADHIDRTLPSISDYNILLNGPGGEGTVAPTGSVNDVFLSNSYGAFSLDSTIYPWVTVSQTEAYYADNQSGLGPKIFEAVREALDVIDSDPSIDLTDFNTDLNAGDEYIDAITVFHSGYGAEFGGVDCNGASEVQRIWSHSWFMFDGTWTSQDGSVSVSNYHINPGLWGICGSAISRIGVIAHETAHFLGLPDLYDPNGGNGIGIYCLMSDSWGFDGSQYFPPMLSAWSKLELGWVTPATLNFSGDFTLRQSWQYADVYKIELGSPSEYLLIENRQPGSYDKLLPLGGLAIWHVDDYMYLYGNSREGYPGQAGNWPANGLHYHVALLQADGKYDLEKGKNRGDYLDLFRYDYYFGVDYLYPSETSNPMIGPFPNTDSYRVGVVQRTGHFISGISATSSEMTFSFLSSSPCQFDEIYFDLTLLTDGKGNEVSWMLVETYTDLMVLSGYDYDSYTQINVNQCLPAKCYTFIIYDAGNDGLCCTYGQGGYSVRVNGLKVASGNSYGIMDRTDLQCNIPPTISPTPAPFTLAPSEMPSSAPSAEPSLSPTGWCGRGKGLLDIRIEGNGFDNDEISWSVQDIYGNTLLSNVDIVIIGGLYHIQECIILDTCYTFSTQDSIDSEILRYLYTVKLDGKILTSGSNIDGDHSTMFGRSCLQNGDTTCTNDSAADHMSMFRLELASNDGGSMYWTLIDGNKQVIQTAGPFGNCQVNTLAMCLPSEDCYELVILEITPSLHDKGLYTVLFSHEGDMIQNYTGSVNTFLNRVYLGTCYDANFG